MGLGDPGTLTRGLLINKIKHKVLDSPLEVEEPVIDTGATSSTAGRMTNRSMPQRTDQASSQKTVNETAAKSVQLHPIPNLNPLRPNTMLFGKFQGKSYEEVLEDSPEYCEWVIQTAEMEPSSGELLHFAKFLTEKGLMQRDVKGK